MADLLERLKAALADRYRIEGVCAVASVDAVSNGY